MKLRSLTLLITFTILSDSHASDRPNVILFMADDMGMGDTSAYQDFTGNSDRQQIDTPNMERLARMGVRFTDAHTPASRCSPTRYGLLTGRYPWRNRLKFWVLFGVQGDPMIERDRPTLGTLFQDHGYRTAMFGKWHVGLRYRNSEGKPAAGWEDADLTQPMFDTPADHGFDIARFTSRSHGTSGPATDSKEKNGPDQSRGPGHVHNHEIVGATGNGKELVSEGPHAYVLHKLGSRHSDHAMEFLSDHVTGETTRNKPFFLYYPSNSNHGPYTPDSEIGGKKIAGASRNKAGEPMNVRSDYIYENDIALGRLIDFLEATDDPRNKSANLIDNTIVIFTSDNGAEIPDKFATGPFRSNKGSCYEGGHRVPFIVAWKAGGVGDGDASTAGKTSHQLIGLIDMFATFSDILGVDLPDLRNTKGAEDSTSVLKAWKGEPLGERKLFFNDNKETKKDNAVLAFRRKDKTGDWKIFFDAGLARHGKAEPFALFDLNKDVKEESNRIDDPELAPLIESLTNDAHEHRNSGGHRLAEKAKNRITLDFAGPDSLPAKNPDTPKIIHEAGGATATIRTSTGKPFSTNEIGTGISGGRFKQVDDGEAILVSFDKDVLIESVGIIAGNGACGGFYTVGENAPLAIYCTDADVDSKDQSGLISDVGWLKKGEILKLDSSPHYGTETPGRWRLSSLTYRQE